MFNGFSYLLKLIVPMKSWFQNTHNDECIQITRNLKKKTSTTFI